MSQMQGNEIIKGNISTQKVKLSSGYEVPQVALGVYKAPNDGTTEQAVKWAFDAGYRHIDSAARYRNEEAVGRAVREWTKEHNVPREEIFITTKLWDDDQKSTTAAIDESLRKLDLGYIDLYLIHSPEPGEMSFVNAWREMEAAVEAGKLHSIGVSNFDVEHLDALLKVARIKPVVNQIESHPFFAHEVLRKETIARGLRIEAYSPMAQGARLSVPRSRRLLPSMKRRLHRCFFAGDFSKATLFCPSRLRSTVSRRTPFCSTLRSTTTTWTSSTTLMRA